MKKPKGRNLLERLEIWEDAAPRLITSEHGPFANNDAERPVRMLKVHAKISGCFKTFEMAQGFCKMRGHIIASCKKNDISAYESIKMLVQGQTPEFIKARLSLDVR
jgi:transposase